MGACCSTVRPGRSARDNCGATALFQVTAVFAFAAGCGGGQESLTSIKSESGPKHDSGQVTELEPVRVSARRDRERIVIDAYDASGLFERASGLFGTGRYEEASVAWRKLEVEFPASKLAAPSLYNSGLSNERLDRYHEAAADFSKLVENYPESQDVTDALFRLAGAYERLDQSRVRGAGPSRPTNPGQSSRIRKVYFPKAQSPRASEGGQFPSLDGAFTWTSPSPRSSE